MLLRLLLLAIALPVLLRLLMGFLGGGFSTGTESSAPRTTAPTVATTSDDVALPPASTPVTSGPPTTAGTTTAADSSASAVPTGTASAPSTAAASSSATSSSGVDEIIDGVLGSSTARPSGATAVYPPVTLTGRECGRDGADAYAAAAAGNDRTTCAFAVATRAAYRAAGGAGRSVSIAPFSEARGTTVRLACTGAQPVRCTGSTGALVYLYGGKAVFR